MDFFEQYENWEADCLAEFTERYGEHECEVEFSEQGDAYVHGIFGVEHIRKAVTPWDDSEHYVDWRGD